MPKSSSRAITSAAGTADVIETIADIEFSPEEVKKIIKKTGGCLVWGGSLEMLTADTKIIQIEKVLKLDPEAQLLASIISKKLAMGSNYILIDIPCGLGAKVSSEKAKSLKRKFEIIGNRFHKKINCVLTDGSHPIGNGIGPILELKDVLKVLEQSKERPLDLEEKSIFLAGELFELTGKSKKGQGKKLAREILFSGKAYKKFVEIIEAQNGSIKKFSEANFKKDIFAEKDSYLNFDNKNLVFLSRILGCPNDKFSGIYLPFNKPHHVKKGEKSLTIYSSAEARLSEAIKFCRNGFKIIHD